MEIRPSELFNHRWTWYGGSGPVDSFGNVTGRVLGVPECECRERGEPAQAAAALHPRRCHARLLWPRAPPSAPPPPPPQEEEKTEAAGELEPDIDLPPLTGNRHGHRG